MCEALSNYPSNLHKGNLPELLFLTYLIVGAVSLVFQGRNIFWSYASKCTLLVENMLKNMQQQDTN